MINPEKRNNKLVYIDVQFQFHIGMINPEQPNCLKGQQLKFQFHIGMINPWYFKAKKIKPFSFQFHIGMINPKNIMF